MYAPVALGEDFEENFIPRARLTISNTTQIIINKMSGIRHFFLRYQCLSFGNLIENCI